MTVKTRLPVDATDPGGRGAPAVGEDDLLTLTEAAYGDRVVRLVAGHLDERAGRRPVQGLDEVDRERHPGSALESLTRAGSIMT